MQSGSGRAHCRLAAAAALLIAGGAFGVLTPSLAAATAASPWPASPTVTPAPVSPTVSPSPTPAGPTGTPAPASPTVRPTQASPTASPTSAGLTVSPTPAAPTVTPTPPGPTASPAPASPTVIPRPAQRTAKSRPRRRPKADRAGQRHPNLARGSAYLVTPANLIDGHFYESFPGYADFGLTMDGAFALAATGDDRSALRDMLDFLDSDGKDPSGTTINDWTGIGTRSASGGAIGKEALLAEVVGANPRHFGGHNLIAALSASVCTRASRGSNSSCAGAGNYAYATSVFDQALGIMAQLRAGQPSHAAASVAFLEGLQSADGAFPSLIPASGGPDVDSTAMAVMALALAPGARAAADVSSGAAWIAHQQERNGGFGSVGGESVNSTGLAIQALTLKAAAYRSQISQALSFLASEQNPDGGFRAYATGPRGSNVRASTQAIGGAVGTSFGLLRRDVTVTATPGRTGQPAPSAAPSAVGEAAAPEAVAVITKPAVTVTVTVTATPSPTQPAAAAPAPSPEPAASTSPPLLAINGRDVSLNTALWGASVAVAVVAAVVIGLLLVRRRRLYPSGGGTPGRPAGGAGS
jgi:hypothetical protein